MSGFGRLTIIVILTLLGLIPNSAWASSTVSRPEIFEFTQGYRNEKGESVVQTNTLYFATEERLAEVIEFAEADLKKEGFSEEAQPGFAIVSSDFKDLFLKNSAQFQPKTTVSFSSDEFQTRPIVRSPSSEITNESFQALEKEFAEYYSQNFKLRRITLILSRFTVNGVVSTFGFIAGGIPWSHAIVLGSLTGALSGTIQILTRPLNDFISTNKYGIELAKKLGIQVSTKVEKSPFFSMLLKWGGVEVTFLTVLKMTAYALGDIPTATSLTSETLSIFAIAAKSLVSQGLWDTSVAKELSPQIRAAILERDFVKASRLRFRTEISGFAGSMIWSAAAITDMMGIPIGNYVFGSLAATGGGNHVRLLIKDKSRNFTLAFKTLPTWCDRLLSPKKKM